MKKKLNLLLLKDIKIYLGCENFEYLVMEENQNFIIKPLPPVFNESTTLLKSYLAYNYDDLCKMHQDLYRNNYRSFLHIGDNNYVQDTKIYKVKKKSFK